MYIVKEILMRKRIPTTGVGLQRLEGLHELLVAFGYDVPHDLKKFRSWVNNQVRVGRIAAPVRLPRQDGTKGTVGWYSEDTFQRLAEISKTRGERPALREQMAALPIPRAPMRRSQHQDEGERKSKRNPPKSNIYHQRQVGLSVWLPDSLLVDLEDLVHNGYALSLMLFYGLEWLFEITIEVRLAVLEPYASAHGIKLSDPALFQGTASYLAALDLAARGFKVIDELKRKHGISQDEATSRWKLKFKITVEGQIEVSAVEPVGRIPSEVKDGSRG
jgi:hypothetical protein